ncbi:MAG: TetR/AcrR family transcriptional regulator [Gammaproteobacteria bacterium]
MARPREFDSDEALKIALLLFWEKGYEGTSLNDLTEAMGITRPSIYACYGNKEGLFRAALDRYESCYLAFVKSALNEPTARGMVEKLLHGYADVITMDDRPHGCLGTNGAVACSKESEDVRQELVKRRARNEGILRDCLARAKKRGELSRAAEPDTLAKYVMTVAQGLSVQAKAGATRKALHKVVAVAIGAFAA